MNNIPKGIIFSCRGFNLTKKEINFFSEINPFGFILFSRNFKSRNQLKNLISQLKQVSINKDSLIFVDQEGGRVQRFANDEFLCHPSQKAIGDAYKKNKKNAKRIAYLNAKIIGYYLKNVGVDVNCSPVIDILYAFGNQIIGDRSFGEDPKTISILGLEYCKGLKDSGILPVIKHFPGHGRAKLDSHLDLPVITENKYVLKNNDIRPFMDFKKELFFMIAHILYNKIDNLIAPYSKKILNNLLRVELGFEGLVISDDLSMKALKGTLEERTKSCISGGCDLILYCSGKVEDMIKIYKNCKVIDKNKFEYFQSYRKKITVKNDYIKDEIKEFYESGII